MVNACPDMMNRHGDLSIRDETGRPKFEDKHWWHRDPENCMGGQGIFMTANALKAVLSSILANDEKLLKPATRDLLFEPGLSFAAVEGISLKATTMEPWKPAGLLAADVKRSFAYGGVVTLEDVKRGKGRKEGTISWSGLTNNFWVCQAVAPAIDIAY